MTTIKRLLYATLCKLTSSSLGYSCGPPLADAVRLESHMKLSQFERRHGMLKALVIACLSQGVQNLS
ncbi:hypothetical protein E5Q_03364 [Mixia osmundae IAM 14324]|uniref:Uncharacterized protein n=1 Tax=Mixia osmundae (strain CBS 9802 / IAM 14324 / JCM 22182 / KY 12970) TaxID=764103 RepID=G7E1I3_MIXOS|nr:hypothetical protein E5Q_03364 [Mixia osmundae IAM 14324]